MSNKTKKMNKAVKEAEVIEEEEVVETAKVEATVEDAKNEATEVEETETESKDSETEVVVETKKVLRPVAYVKNNWKKLTVKAIEGVVVFGVGVAVGSKLSGGEQPSETTEEVIDAEFVEKNDDVETQEEE